jgi:predicted nuclease of predicted toxin-antitoxin system
LKFLADINVSRRVVARLREEGFDVVRASELMDARSPDVNLIQEAQRLGAVLISHDQDFTAILATSGAVAPSLINLRVSQLLGVEPLARRIAAVLRATEPDLVAGAIVTLDDAGVRIHNLPVGRA